MAAGLDGASAPGYSSGDEVLRTGSRFGPQDDQHELGDEVGSGAAARVYTCRRLKTGEQMAAKVINLQKLRLLGDLESHMVKLDREVRILSELQHPRLVRLHFVHKTPNWLFLVMELVSGGELFDQIVQNRSLNEVEAKYIFRQLLEGVGYMHSKHVIHRDLKPENILISATRQAEAPLAGKLHDVKIADFGLSKVISDGTSFAKTFVGTPQYWAPEVLAVQGGGGSYSQAADYWSLGAVLFVMLCGRYPFDGKKMPLEEQIRTATFSMTSAAWQKISAEAKDLVRGLLRVKPSERLGLQECLRHPWFTEGLAPSTSMLAAANAPTRPNTQAPPVALGPVVTEVFSATPGGGPVGMVTQPSTQSDMSFASGRKKSDGDEASRPTSRTGSASGTALRPDRADSASTSPQAQKPWTQDLPSIQIEGDSVGCVSHDQDLSAAEKVAAEETIFCLNELLKLQVSIAGSLEMACLAFRHADVELSDAIRKTFRQARDLSSFAANVVAKYAQVAQQVSLYVLPDLKLAVQEKEPSLAVSLLGMVKGWVSDMKKDGEEIQRRYMGLQESVHNLIQRAQHTKTDADRRLAEAVQAAESEGGLAASPRTAGQLLALGPPKFATEQDGDDGPGWPSPGRAQSSDEPMEGGDRESSQSGAVSFGPSAHDGIHTPRPKGGQEHRLNVPFSMNVWTKQLFEQLSKAQEGSGHKAIEDDKSSGDVPMDDGHGASSAGASTMNVEAQSEAWKRDVLDLLFMAPGVIPSHLPKMEPFTRGITEDADQARSAFGKKADAAGSADMEEGGADVTMGEAVWEDALVRYTPTSAMTQTAEAVTHSSASLLRALRELKRVDEILQGCSAFWTNMDCTVEKLSQMKEHTECLVSYAANSKPLRERFEQRLGQYQSFWNSLERLCRQYCLDHQASSKRMYEVIREVADAADVIDTAQSARMGMALAMREKQRRQDLPGDVVFASAMRHGYPVI